MQPQLDDYNNIPIRLTPEELINPFIVLKNFFGYYNLSDIRNRLDDLIIQAMSSDMPELEDWKTRNSLMYFRSQLESMIEANYVLLNLALKPQKKVSRERKGKRKKKAAVK